MDYKEVARHVYCFNEEDNGGEQLILTTIVYDDKVGGIFFNQELTLGSYCNSASFNLTGAQITPKLLRELANQLEEVEQKYYISKVAGI